MTVLTSIFASMSGSEEVQEVKRANLDFVKQCQPIENNLED